MEPTLTESKAKDCATLAYVCGLVLGVVLGAAGTVLHGQLLPYLGIAAVCVLLGGCAQIFVHRRIDKAAGRLLGLVVVFVSCSAQAWAADPVAPTSALQCYPMIIHDADTIRAIIFCPLLKVDSQQVDIRAFGYDAWEIDHTRQTVVVTDEEIAKAKQARMELVALLETNQLWAEPSGKSDPYGRTSAVLWLKSRSDGSWIFLPKYAEDHGWLRVPRQGTGNRGQGTGEQP